MSCLPRRHHYVTRAYLAGFLEPTEQLLFCYGRNKSSAFKAAPEKLANIRDYYSSKLPDGTLDASLEEKIAVEFEDPGLLILKFLCAGSTRLGWSKRMALSRLIGLQRLRVPYEREFMDEHSKRSTEHMLSQLDKHSSNGAIDPEMSVAISPFNVDPPIQEWSRVSRSELLTQRNVIREDPQAFSRSLFIEMAQTFANVFGMMKWTIQLATGNLRFITSDCPVVITFDDKANASAGLMRSDCQIDFPLSSKTLLTMRHDVTLINRLAEAGGTKKAKRKLLRVPEIAVKRLGDSIVSTINERHADQAYRWAFSGQPQPWLSGRLKGRARNIRQVYSQQGNGFTVNSISPD